MKIKILVVDDNFPTRKVLGRVLEEFGACDFAENGKIAVDAVRLALEEKDPYQLICLDIRMPEMDGTNALKQIRAMETLHGINLGKNSAKIVMITSVDEHASIFQTFRENCDGYLIKPVRKNELIVLMRGFGMI